MQTSANGQAVLEQEEGVVLRAYRDVAGVWTIYTGLTAASGVVKPKAGMVVTREEGARLLALALRANYEPAVDLAIGPGTPEQHEFDAALLFHFNTGAIGRASWVGHWIKRAWDKVEPAFKSWRKAGGKIIGGLVDRRQREFDLLRYGRYPVTLNVRPMPPVGNRARIAAPLTAAQVPAIREALIALGYGGNKAESHLRLEAVLAFQKAHGLTEDGVVGRATASAIQRALDVRRKAAQTALPAAAATPVATTDVADQLAGLPWLGPVLLGLVALYALSLVWRYRDTVAAAIDRPLPRLAARLRSF